MEESLTIETNQRSVNITLLKSDEAQFVLIIAPAMGVKSSFYRTFAEYFVAHGYHVILFDYFGMFKTESNQNNKNVRIVDWGYLDLKSVIDFASDTYPQLPLFFIGHSVGGQLLPLAENCDRIKAACLIAAQNASKYNWSGVNRMMVSIFWHIIIPFCTRFLNGLPGWAYGGRHTLHPSVAREWGTWGRNKNGMLGENPKVLNRYGEYNVPSKFISFYDDEMFAPKSSVQKLYKDIGAETKEHLHISKEEARGVTIKHFNFFRKKCRFLWPELQYWFNKFS